MSNSSPSGDGEADPDPFQDLDKVPWVSGAINGVSGFFSVFVGVGLVTLLDAALAFQQHGSNSSIEIAETFRGFVYGLSWVFYDAHLVPLDTQATMTFVDVWHALGPLPDVAYVVPVAGFLFVSGRRVARGNGRAFWDTPSLAVLGATITVGYLPLLVAGAALASVQGIGPSIPLTVALGIALPAVFGGLGGALANR